MTKRGGIVYVAFMSRVKHLQNALRNPLSWKPLHRAEAIQSFMETGIFNHEDKGRFTNAYFENIDDIAPFMESEGFKTIQLIGSTNATHSFYDREMDYWGIEGEEEYEQIKSIICQTAENPYLLGASSHLLYIGERC